VTFGRQREPDPGDVARFLSWVAEVTGTPDTW
jgi:hypothetical protein